MKSILGFFKRLWREEDSQVSIRFKGIARKSNFTELTKEEMESIRSVSISSKKD